MHHAAADVDTGPAMPPAAIPSASEALPTDRNPQRRGASVRRPRPPSGARDRLRAPTSPHPHTRARARRVGRSRPRRPSPPSAAPPAARLSMFPWPPSHPLPHTRPRRPLAVRALWWGGSPGGPASVPLFRTVTVCPGACGSQPALGSARPLIVRRGPIRAPGDRRHRPKGTFGNWPPHRRPDRRPPWTTRCQSHASPGPAGQHAIGPHPPLVLASPVV